MPKKSSRTVEVREEVPTAKSRKIGGSQSPRNKFSQMLSHARLTDDVGTEQRRDDTSTHLTDDVDVGTDSRRSLDPSADDTRTDQNVSRRNLAPMEVDDTFENLHDQSPPIPALQNNSSEYLKKSDFDYTMTLIDKKINSLFKLCRHMSDKQHETSKDIKKIVALDELSGDFWNRACKEAVKKLLPTILFPSVSEFRKALEDYLAEHADHFIESIGRNNWVSMFDDKLLSEIKNKCRSKRNDISANIRRSMFLSFGDKLEYIDNNATPSKIAEWKASELTKAAYNELFYNEELLDKIGYSVFKQYKGKEIPAMHCAYILSICDIVLNPKGPGIKCNDRAVVKRVNAFMRAYENKTPMTQEIMRQIAEEEAEAIINNTNKKRNEASSQGSESELIADDDDDYDDFVAGLEQCF